MVSKATLEELKNGSIRERSRPEDLANPKGKSQLVLDPQYSSLCYDTKFIVIETITDMLQKISVTTIKFYYKI